MPASPAEIAATLSHRAKRRRVEILLVRGSPEEAALDKLAAVHGSDAAAVKAALVECAGRRAPEPLDDSPEF